MDLFDASLQRLRFESGLVPAVPQGPALPMLTLTPTWVLVDGGDEGVGEALAAWMDGQSAPGRNLQRQLRRRGPTDLLRDDQGQLTLGGKRCCYELMRTTSNRMHLLRLPHDVACSCGSTWRVEYRSQIERGEVRRGR